MGQRSHASFLRALGAKPFGPWERREFSAGQMVEMGQKLFGHTASGEAALLRVGFTNNRYAVWLTERDTAWGKVEHLWVSRHDGETARSWADLQRIKNELVKDGPARLAVEVFPPEAELIDQTNMYHLWVLPLGFRLPFALGEPR